MFPKEIDGKRMRVPDLTFRHLAATSGQTFRHLTLIQPASYTLLQITYHSHATHSILQSRLTLYVIRIFLSPTNHNSTGKITERGVLAPLRKHLYGPIIELLDQEGLGCTEEVVVE